MKLADDEVYITEKEFYEGIFEYPYITVNGIKYRQRRAVRKGGVICCLAEDEEEN